MQIHLELETDTLSLKPISSEDEMVLAVIIKWIINGGRADFILRPELQPATVVMEPSSFESEDLPKQFNRFIACLAD